MLPYLPSPVFTLTDRVQKLLWGYTGPVDHAIAKALATPAQKRRGFYYLFNTATRADQRRRGHCAAIVRRIQARAAEEALPVWLEASTATSHAVFKGLGFVDVEEIVSGRGKVDRQGEEKKDGEGVSIWGMIWWPPEKGGEQEAGEEG